ncbi:hypothetical protein ACLOJK_020118 [Asimina triloba]
MAQFIQVQAASLKNLETQMGQMANTLAQFNRKPGAVSNNTEPNPKQDDKAHCQAVSLRSGKVLPEPEQPELSK